MEILLNFVYTFVTTGLVSFIVGANTTTELIDKMMEWVFGLSILGLVICFVVWIWI